MAVTIPMSKKTTHRNFFKQIGYYLLSSWVALSILTTVFLLVPMTYFYMRPLTWDVDYMQIKPIQTEVGKPLIFESTRHNITSGINVFSDTMICVDSVGNIILNEQTDSVRNVEAQPMPTSVRWAFAEGNLMFSQPYEKCRVYSRISRMRPFVGMVSQTLKTDWFEIKAAQ